MIRIGDAEYPGCTLPLRPRTGSSSFQPRPYLLHSIQLSLLQRSSPLHLKQQSIFPLIPSIYYPLISSIASPFMCYCTPLYSTLYAPVAASSMRASQNFNNLDQLLCYEARASTSWLWSCGYKNLLGRRRGIRITDRRIGRGNIDCYSSFAQRVVTFVNGLNGNIQLTGNVGAHCFQVDRIFNTLVFNATMLCLCPHLNARTHQLTEAHQPC